MKLIDYFSGAAIQAFIVTWVAVGIAPSFFSSSFGVLEIIAAFVIILCGYLASVISFRLLPKSIYPNLLVMCVVGLFVAALFSGVFLFLTVIFESYFQFPVQKGVEYIFIVALTGSFVTWLVRHIT